MKIFPSILLVLTFAVILSWTVDEVHYKECQKSGKKCPCIPKCCKEGQVLTAWLDKKSSRQSIDHLNGFKCISRPKQAPKKPIVNFAKDSKFENEHSPGFYHSKFPTCGGLGNAWEYEFSFNFSLNADHKQDQILTIYDHYQAKVSQVLNFMNLNDIPFCKRQFIHRIT